MVAIILAIVVEGEDDKVEDGDADEDGAASGAVVDGGDVDGVRQLVSAALVYCCRCGDRNGDDGCCVKDVLRVAAGDIVEPLPVREGETSVCVDMSLTAKEREIVDKSCC